MNATERIRRNMQQRNLPRVDLSVRVPPHVIDDLTELAKSQGFESYRGLAMVYISEGMRHDLAERDGRELADKEVNDLGLRLIRSGVPEEKIEAAMSEMRAAREA